MASSRRSPPVDAGDGGESVKRLRDAVSAAIVTHAPRARRLAVALSGGRDSMALLDAVEPTVRAQALALVVVHVHHGLSPNADRWTAFCEQACAERRVECVVARTEVVRKPRLSVEAEARRARYTALASAARARSLDVVLLAHHADDQAETLLLQLARGAGPAGLAAMPGVRVEDGVAWLRPFLDITRAEIDAYVRARRLAYVDDESNEATRFRRNALRHDVVPALRAALPGYPRTLARAALCQAEAAALLDELACVDASGAFDGTGLDCAVFARLSEPRARNLLRWFLRQHALPPPSLKRLRAMLSQIAKPRRDARIDLAHAGARIGVHHGRVFVHPPAPKFRHVWHGEPEIELPHGVLRFVRGVGDGLGATALEGAMTVVRPRSGGERIQIASDRPRRALSAWFNETGVAVWERAALPLVFCGDALAAVPGLGVDVAFAAAPGHAAWRLVWEPRSMYRTAAPLPVEA